MQDSFLRRLDYNPIATTTIVLESIIRAALLCAYLVTKTLKARRKDISDPNAWAAYSHPYNANPQIPGHTLLLLVMLISGVSGLSGVLLMKVIHRRTRWKTCAAELVTYGWASSLALLLSAFTTNLIKICVGEYRPDYLNRCFPSVYDAKSVPPTHWLNITSPVPACELANIFDQEDGRRSFPSGHSSYFAAVCLLAALYLRNIWNSLAHATPPQFFLGTKGLALSGLVVLGLVVPIWVGCTRVSDRRHHPSDVIVGLCIGWTCALLVNFTYFPSLIELRCRDPMQKTTTSLINAERSSLIESSSDQDGILIHEDSPLVQLSVAANGR